MISYKFASKKPQQTNAAASQTGERTTWIDVRGMSFIDASIHISRMAGLNIDDAIVIDALESGYVGIHRSGWSGIAKAYANHPTALI